MQISEIHTSALPRSHLIIWNEKEHEKIFILAIFPTPDRIEKKII